MKRRPGQIQQRMTKDRTRLLSIQTDGESYVQQMDRSHGLTDFDGWGGAAGLSEAWVRVMKKKFFANWTYTSLTLLENLYGIKAASRR